MVLFTRLNTLGFQGIHALAKINHFVLSRCIDNWKDAKHIDFGEMQFENDSRFASETLYGSLSNEDFERGVVRLSSEKPVRKPERGAPRKAFEDHALEMLSAAYLQLTGKPPSRSTREYDKSSPDGGRWKMAGPFVRFCREAEAIYGLSIVEDTRLRRIVNLWKKPRG